MTSKNVSASYFVICYCKDLRGFNIQIHFSLTSIIPFSLISTHGTGEARMNSYLKCSIDCSVEHKEDNLPVSLYKHKHDTHMIQLNEKYNNILIDIMSTVMELFFFVLWTRSKSIIY